MKAFLTILTLIIGCFSIHAQSNYLLDSSRFSNVFFGGFFDLVINKYIYDEQGRLIRKNFINNSDEGYTTYDYFEDRIVESSFYESSSFPFNTEWDKVIRYLNEDDYEIKVEYFIGSFLIQKDSIVLDGKNRMLEEYKYSSNTNSDFFLNGYKRQIFEDDQLIYQLEDFYSQMELLFSFENEFKYNEHRLLEEHVESFYYESFGTQTTVENYAYEDLRIKEKKVTVSSSNNSEWKTLEKYSYLFPYIFIEHSSVVGDIGFPYYLEEIKQSNSLFYENDSIQEFNLDKLVNEVANTEKFIEELDLLRIRKLEKNFSFFDQSLSRVVIDEKFYKINDQDVEVVNSQEDFTLFPNPTHVFDLVIIQLDNPDLHYNQIQIYNEMGQVVSRIPVPQSRFIQFRVPQLNQGIYFIRLQDDSTPVTRLKKMVIQ